MVREAKHDNPAIVNMTSDEDLQVKAQDYFVNF